MGLFPGEYGSIESVRSVAQNYPDHLHYTLRLSTPDAMGPISGNNELLVQINSGGWSSTL